MSAPAPHFRAFVRSVHRRLVVVRAAERTGLGMLAGCVAAGALLPLLYWGAQPAVVPAMFLLGLGTVAGAAWGVVSRPSMLSAAMEADRQLGLADLLGTATACHPHAGAHDPWQRTVLAVADDRCRQLTASQVLLNRFGARAWGGIGLATALVLTLAALSSQPTNVRATPERAGNPAISPVAPRQPESQRAHSAVVGTARPISRARPDGSTESGSRDQTGPPAAPVQTADKANPSSAAQSSAGGDEGLGGGAGRARQPQPSTPAPTASDAASPDAATGQPVGGSGRASAALPSSRTSADAGGTTSAASPGPSDRVPPWQSESWPSDRRAAADAVDAGRVPDAYRDLVRDYFDRP